MSKNILIELYSYDTAKCHEFGIEHKARGGKHGVIDPLCRKLLKLGANPSRYIEVRRNGTLCFEINRTLEEWAGKRLYENDTTGAFQEVKYVENDWFKNGQRTEA